MEKWSSHLSDSQKVVGSNPTRHSILNKFHKFHIYTHCYKIIYVSLAQRESTSFTPKGSTVRVCQDIQNNLKIYNFIYFSKMGNGTSKNTIADLHYEFLLAKKEFKKNLGVNFDDLTEEELDKARHLIKNMEQNFE